MPLADRHTAVHQREAGDLIEARSAHPKPKTNRDLHIFCDASERAYWSVAYLQTEDAQNEVNVSFVLARSRVMPKKYLSMPRLELSAVLTSAQLASILHTKLTIPIKKIILWSDSTTVLHWIRSESCHYKVFVGTRVGTHHSGQDPEGAVQTTLLTPRS